MWLFDFFHSFLGYAAGISFSELISLFWFLFFIEIPRYYLLDFIILILNFFRRNWLYGRDKLARENLYKESPFLTIIIPGKNEGKHIYKLALSLREQTFQNFELVIIDDGSDDDTPTICESLLKNGYISRFYRTSERGGKASAANLGLLSSRAKYIIHLDADSSLDRNALEEILLPFFQNPNVGAVGGCVKVRNTNYNLCTSLQSIEYLESIMVGRTVASEINIYRTISGAFGAFRSDVLKQVGAWDIGPGLDGDITQKIRKSGYRVVFRHEAICLTSVPTSFFNLFRQRLRWSRSLIRFRLRKHRNVLDIRYANFNIFNFASNLDNLIFNFLFDILWIFYILNLVASNMGHLLNLFLLKFLIMIPLGLLSFLMVMALTERKRAEFHLVLLTPLESLYTGFFLRITRILAAFSELFFFRSYRDDWNPRKTSQHAEIDRF